VEQMFIDATEVSKILRVSKSRAYKVIKTLNAELKARGYITIAGRVNKKYFIEKIGG
jgi:hypothetical protein